MNTSKKISLITIATGLVLIGTTVQLRGADENGANRCNDDDGSVQGITYHYWGATGACYDGKAHDLPTFTGEHCGTHELSSGNKAHKAC